MWGLWGWFHLTHLCITYLCVRRSGFPPWGLVALCMWWIAHLQHNKPNEVDAEGVFLSMAIFLTIVITEWMTQDQEWSVGVLILIGVMVCFLTLLLDWLGVGLYKHLSGSLFFIGSASVCLNSFMRQKF